MVDAGQQPVHQLGDPLHFGTGHVVRQHNHCVEPSAAVRQGHGRGQLVCRQVQDPPEVGLLGQEVQEEGGGPHVPAAQTEVLDDDKDDGRDDVLDGHHFAELVPQHGVGLHQLDQQRAHESLFIKILLGSRNPSVGGVLAVVQEIQAALDGHGHIPVVRDLGQHVPESVGLPHGARVQQGQQHLQALVNHLLLCVCPVAHVRQGSLRVVRKDGVQQRVAECNVEHVQLPSHRLDEFVWPQGVSLVQSVRTARHNAAQQVNAVGIHGCIA
mmetsp:Transcript_83193/g.138778  ORF Transcript_83193/g.138778 Transcript_83193/m.138778 type:complete len:269 (+) Transcript_83193:640-1446(+)